MFTGGDTKDEGRANSAFFMQMKASARDIQPLWMAADFFQVMSFKSFQPFNKYIN